MLPKFLTRKKIAFALLFLFLLSTLFSKTIQAFSTSTIRGGYLFNFEGAVFKTEEMNLQSFVNETFKAVGASIWTSLVGCISCDEKEREKYPGFIVTVGNLIASIYASPPASGVEYLADLGNRIGIARPVLAQEEGGTGFKAMKNVRPIWAAFRNVSYVFFVLILVFMGFAIMFRVKISPQAVISIQSALPKIVLALILITFSYAIVGLLIDLMYVFLALISNIFIGEGGIIQSQFGRMGDFLVSLSNLAKHFAKDSVGGAAVYSGLFFFMATVVVFFVSLFLGPIGWLFALVGAIIMLIVLIRCFFTLLKAYAMIIINLIFAPFQILIGVLPGSNAIGSWFRNLIANIAVLPAMFAMFYIGNYFILSGLNALWEEGPWAILSAILTGWLNPLGPILSSFLVAFTDISPWDFMIILFLPLVGLMILWMAPKVSDMIKAFFAGKPFEYGTAIGEAMGPARIGAAFGLGAGAERISRGWTQIQKDRFMTVVGELQKMLARGSAS